MAILIAAAVAIAVVPRAFGAGPARAARGSTKVAVSRTIAVTEGTNIAATVSPDHSKIIMDLQGVLFSLPFSGGKAKPLTDPFLEPARPHWSPKGDAVVFEAYKGGTFHIWMMNPDGSGLRELTDGHGDDREPRFSPDGTKVAFASDRAFQGSYDIWVADVATGKLTAWTSDPADEFEPSWSPDGTEIAFISGTPPSPIAETEPAHPQTIQAVNARGVARTLATAPRGAHLNSPTWSPDGKRIAYTQFSAGNSRLMVSGERVGTSDDVFPFHATWLNNDRILYTAGGKILVTGIDAQQTTEIPFEADFTLNRPAYERKNFEFDLAQRPVKGIVSPALSPDGRHIVFEAVNQLWLMEVGKKPQQLTRDAFYKEDPSWSPDGKRIAYSSDKAGTEDLYILDVASRVEKRLTSLPDSAEVSSAWSPDGKMLAFQDQRGATFTIDIAGGQIKQVIAPQFAPSKPSWSANGKTIAISGLKKYTQRFREGTSQIITCDVATGALKYTEPAPFQSLSTRGEDGPVYSPDGSAVAFVMDSVIWIRPVDADGVPVGEARQITREVSDAPTWSGDSKHLLYLSNGKLRLVSADGSSHRAVPLEMTWQREKTQQQTLVHAGRLWDGRGPDARDNIDIIVADNRIRTVEPHSDAAHRSVSAAGGRIIDASNRTVIPGLWESHTHEWISGKFYGDRLGRLWLAYGVTELQSQGDPVYRSVETREAFASNTRVGPRFFASGEAIDGERVYYNFMRPTMSDAQLELELLRAQAMDYDLVKTYVRLPHARQEKVTRFVHQKMGVVTSSHYMLPGMAYGMDSMSHVSATARLGFAYTRSAAGISYRDMRTLFAQSGMFVISTPFSSSTLYSEDPGMVDDPRLLALNTPWDEKSLRTKRDRAVKTDQAVALKNLREEEETLIAILRAGGIMLTGTDSPLDNVATALHLALRAEVKFGLAPWQALQTATLLPAKAFGVEGDLGTVETGKLADLAFIAGDPLKKIEDVTNVESVMKDGRFYTVADLMKPFAR